MKTYWIPQNNVCWDCQWPLFNGETYCPDCQGARDKFEEIQKEIDLSYYQPSQNTKLTKKLIVDMSGSEFRRYRRIYGSCIDEKRSECHDMFEVRDRNLS